MIVSLPHTEKKEHYVMNFELMPLLLVHPFKHKYIDLYGTFLVFPFVLL